MHRASHARARANCVYRSLVSSRTLLSLGLAIILACGTSSSDPVSPAPDAGPPIAKEPEKRPVAHPARDHGYPMDGTLRVNHVQVKATHNSYHVETAGNTQADWDYTHAPLDVQLESQGVRGLELDTRLIAASDRFEVFHLPLLDEQTTCRFFADCLRVLLAWSNAHPKHVPIFVQIEPKDLPSDDVEAYFQKLEADITSVWPRERILAPDDIQGDAPTLREAVTTRGWPTLAEARGTILFYVDNHETWRDAYTRGGKNLFGRLMFVDVPEDNPLAAVVIVNDPKNRTRIDAAAKAGFLVRTRADAAGSAEEHAAALATGAHALSSDFPLTLTLPDATPVRCNPASAPKECVSTALEDPTKLR